MSNKWIKIARTRLMEQTGGKCMKCDVELIEQGISKIRVKQKPNNAQYDKKSDRLLCFKCLTEEHQNMKRNIEEEWEKSGRYPRNK